MTNQNGLEWKNKPSHATVPLRTDFLSQFAACASLKFYYICLVAFQDLIGFQVAKIKYEQNLMEKESWQKMQKIDDEIHLAKEKSKTDAEFYKVAYLQYPERSILLTMLGQNYMKMVL